MVFSFVNKRFVHVIKLLQIIITGLRGIVNDFLSKSELKWVIRKVIRKKYPVDFLYNLLYNKLVYVDFLCNLSGLRKNLKMVL